MCCKDSLQYPQLLQMKFQHHLKLRIYLQQTDRHPVPYSTIEYWECSECLQKFSDANGTQVVTDVSDTISTHDILNENVKNYLSTTTEAAQIEALQHPSPFNNQVKKSITWGNIGNGPFRIELSLDDTFAEYKTYSSNTSSFTFPGTLIPGKTYYYRVFDNSGTRLRLSGFSHQTEWPSARDSHRTGLLCRQTR